MDKPSPRTRNLAHKALYFSEPFSNRLSELLVKHNKTYCETALNRDSV
jgi:hypothetical protein